jgi:DNA polymerase/3'-5' exonuclease PolX
MDDKLQTDTEALSDIFHSLSVYYTIAGDKPRANTFDTVGNIMDTYGADTVIGSEARKISGIGESTEKYINEYNETGQVSKLIELQNSYGHIKPFFDAFMDYYGIGPKKALELYNRGIKTEEELLSRGGLTEAQKTAVRWFPQYRQPIARMEMNLINTTIKTRMDKLSDDWLGGIPVKWVMAGSYRRGAPTSNDIDILVRRDTGVTLDIIVEYLSDILKATLKQGSEIYHGILRLSNYLNGHRVDILLVEPDSWWTSLLHFTGSKSFNILMSKRAKQVDPMATLSRKSLDIWGGPYPFDSEEEIFEILGVSYVPPEKRGSVRELEINPGYGTK